VARYRRERSARPGTITQLRGVIFQSDGRSTIGRLFIRPMESLDRTIAGLRRSHFSSPLAMHVGVHVVLAEGQEFVAEQLVGTPYLDLENGLNWTPIEEFRRRDRGGWDVTLPAVHFRGVEGADVEAAVGRLNAIEGHPFVNEDCTMFIERVFDGRRLFADSPLLRLLGVPMRVGDPALPLIRAEAEVDAPARQLLRIDALKELPDARASGSGINPWLWQRRLVPAIVVGAVAGAVARRVLPS
jgi:hypothetical protein